MMDLSIVKTLLPDHTSPETAYLVDDYPYGFRLRCSIRYWLEYVEGKGVRMWSQTTNPKRAGAWNKPKPSIYSRFGGAMFLDHNDHVQWIGLSEYGDTAEALAFREVLGAANHPEARALTDRWIAAKEAYDAARAAGASMHDAAVVSAKVLR